MKLSVIVPAYNHLAAVMTCLNSLRGLKTGPVEFVVQDDCSTEYHSGAVIPVEVASAQRNAVNLGFGGNCNAGAARATGEILFFVNQDVYGADNPPLSYGWDAALLQAFNDPAVGIVGARLLFPNGSIQNAGGQFDAKCQPFHRFLGYSDPNYAPALEAGEVSWTTGAALAIRRDLFVQVGGFDPAYVRGYWEDVDLCMKVCERGYKVWYAPGCTLVHSVGSTGGNPYFMQNAMLFKARWVDSRKIKPDVLAVRERFW